MMKLAIDINGNRITALESNYSNIVKLLEDNKKGLEKIESKVDAHMAGEHRK